MPNDPTDLDVAEALARRRSRLADRRTTVVDAAAIGAVLALLVRAVWPGIDPVLIVGVYVAASAIHHAAAYRADLLLSRTIVARKVDHRPARGRLDPPEEPTP